MKKVLTILIFLFIIVTGKAQSVSIGTTTPDASSMLEIKASNKGLLIPRTSTTTRTAIVNPAKGLLIYDSTASSFWFHNGGAWVQIGASGNGWSLTGNTGTNPTTNFIGTTDAQPLLLKVNNARAGLIEYDPTKGNVALGYQSLITNTNGQLNTAIGYRTLFNNTIGYQNTATGDSALFSNINGFNNTANGSYSLNANTSGSQNTAIGYCALLHNINGTLNTALGAGALYQNQSGGNNTANGSYALFNNVAGQNNTAMGESALNLNNSGGNTAIGYAALSNNISGSNLTAIGNNANVTGDFFTNSTAIGNAALITSSNMIQLGNNAVTQVYAGTGTNATLITGGLRVTGGTMAAGNVLTSDANGFATWQSLSPPTHYIGEIYGGGIVFYITPNALHGLIAETIDQGLFVNWYDAQDSISTASKHSSAGQNYTDWRLPTKNELNLLYMRQSFFSGFTNYAYISSTECDNSNSWVFPILSGGGGCDTKGNTGSVRAIRSF